MDQAPILLDIVQNQNKDCPCPKQLTFKVPDKKGLLVEYKETKWDNAGQQDGQWSQHT